MLYYDLHHWLIFLFVLYGASLAGVGWYQEYAMKNGILDLPNSRSSHKLVVPRGAGMVFVSLWCVLFAALWYVFRFSTQLIWIFAPAFVIGYLGHIDDRKSLKASTRFVVQIACASLSLLAMGATNHSLILLDLLPLWAEVSLLVFSFVWLTNLYNFMDGSDGIAATEGIFIFGIGGYCFYQSGAVVMVLLTWGLAALLLGFLTWNWPKASIFMGDSGSGFLGFMLALVAMIGYIWFDISLLIWVMLSGMFWFDATLTLIRRILAREKWTEAHCSHAYQRLIQAHWSHQKVLLSMIAVNSILAGLALWAYQTPEFLPIAVGMSIIILIIVYGLVEYIKPMFKTWHNKPYTQME